MNHTVVRTYNQGINLGHETNILRMSDVTFPNETKMRDLFTFRIQYEYTQTQCKEGTRVVIVSVFGNLIFVKYCDSRMFGHQYGWPASISNMQFTHDTLYHDHALDRPQIDFLAWESVSPSWIFRQVFQGDNFESATWRYNYGVFDNLDNAIFVPHPVRIRGIFRNTHAHNELFLLVVGTYLTKYLA